MCDKQTQSIRNAATLAVAAVVLIGFAGAGTAAVAASQDGTAEVRVAHMSPDAPAVDVLVDGDAVLEGVEFGAVSDYLELEAGDHEVVIQTSENETVVFEDTITVEADTSYTVAAAGEVSQDTFAPQIYVDDPEHPSEENASVRLVHVSPDAGPVDVTVESTGAVLYDNATFPNATGYVTVPAGDYTLEVRPATEGNDGEVLTTFDVTVEGASTYSAFAAGYLAPDEAAADTPFDLIVAQDTGGNQTTMNATAPVAA
ncbi:DUF4397 domain-containing protein [Halorussus marinus]|uniref:DUF4397 domain-containing protein n=1 Tax=Halorussus marinus TaxID=2505976 RepID=UPI0010921898|nr:DUF4397 domain-containing protein [Halorussus marinus]